MICSTKSIAGDFSHSLHFRPKKQQHKSISTIQKQRSSFRVFLDSAEADKLSERGYGRNSYEPIIPIFHQTVNKKVNVKPSESGR